MILERPNLHADLAAGLSGCPAPQAQAAGELLQGLLSDLRPSSNCSLTGDGFPVVYTFTTADSALRWTADLLPSGTPNQRRTKTHACFMQNATDHGPMPNGGDQHYGAWLGGRVAKDGVLSSKLYQEPHVDSDSAQGPLRSRSFAGFQRRLRMVGYGPGKGRREYYYRFENSSPYLLKRLLEVAGFSARFEDVVDLIQTNSRKPFTDTLPGTAFGASFAYDDSTARPHLTLYFFAHKLWGTDAAIRRKFIALLTAANRDTAPYAAASMPLSLRTQPHTYHDLAALNISEQGFAWGLGLRPIAKF